MERISKFFERLGSPLRNARWSWGSCSDLGVILTTWEDDRDASGRFVRVYGWRGQERSRPGLGERLDHLRALWAGGLAGYALVASAEDTKSNPRRIRSYNNESLLAIVSLKAEPDGSIWAELGEQVPVGRLKRHAARHRVIPSDEAFPVTPAPSGSAKSEAASYVAKLPDIRRWLIEVARRRGTVTYAEARKPFNLRTLEHRHAMERVGHECRAAGEPILTSLIVDEKTGRCSEGFSRVFRRDDVQEREDCYAFWQAARDSGAAAPSGKDPVLPTESLAARAARFAQRETRPDQAAFRLRVFLEHKGACVVTGCKIEAALDAAHRVGRDWRLGQNQGADGLLLRKDIHALYDAKLLTIADDGTVTLQPQVEQHYRRQLLRG